MKMKQRHFNEMKKEIDYFMKINPGLEKMYLTGNFPRSNAVKNLYKRYINDVFWYAMSPDWMAKELYPYLDGSHIQTALRKIIPRPKDFPKD